MRPRRNFRFTPDKTQIFVAVGFRYDQPQSLEYVQYKDPESVRELVYRLLTMEDGADIISIRRVYLVPPIEHKTEDPQEKIVQGVPIGHSYDECGRLVFENNPQEKIT